MIIRTPRKKNFTVIDNRILEDDRLSFKAKGILCYLLSRPDDWQVNDAHLTSIGIDGEASTRSALKEIEDAGYLVRVKQKGKRGRFEWTTYVYDEPHLLESPQDDFPPMENPPMVTPVEPPWVGFPPVDRPPMENPRVENHTLINTKEINTEEQQLPPQRGSSSDAAKKKERGAVHKCWQENMSGTMTGIIGEELNALIDEHGPQAVIKAITVAVNAEVRTMRFVEGVLKKGKARASPSNGNGYQDGKNATVERMEGEEW